MCTCGSKETHVVATRQTADGHRVKFWSDSSVTDSIFYFIVRPDRDVSRGLQANTIASGDLCLYDFAEVNALVKCARRSAGDVAKMRRLFSRQQGPHLRPIWTVVQTDRDSKPIERYWRLPRIRWPGLAIWNRCNAAFPYEVWTVDRYETCKPTGFRFKTLEELGRHLEKEGK